jgi:hypothetical protein
VKSSSGLAASPRPLPCAAKRVAVILSAADYDALCASLPSLVNDLLAGPAWNDDLVEAVNARVKSPSRDVDP